jgi:hypothetical protein
MLRVRVIRLGSSAEPTGVTSNLGSFDDPAVVGLSLDGPQPLVHLSVGSGHFGSSAAVPVDDVVTTDGELDPQWSDHLARAGATWALPLLRTLHEGGALSEDDVVAAHRQHEGTAPLVESAAVARPDVTTTQLRAERAARRARTSR